MSEIYGLGIAMPMNYQAMIDQLQRFGTMEEPVQVTIEAPMIDFKVTVLGNGKMEVSGAVECPNPESLSSDELDAALMWAATALLGVLAIRGVSVVGMEKIERGSHVETKRSEISNSKQQTSRR